MNPLDAFDDALSALAACLDASGHSPACVCGPCAAHEQGMQLLPQLDHLLQVLVAWSRGDAEEPIMPDDIRRLLWMLDEGSGVPESEAPLP